MKKEEKKREKETSAFRILRHQRYGSSLAYYATELVLFFLSLISLSIFLSSSFNSLVSSPDGESFVQIPLNSVLSRPRRKRNDALENKRKTKMKIEIEREERRKIDIYLINKGEVTHQETKEQ